jgi:signal transduction histidine kinase
MLLMNLLTNAMKYNISGKPRIDIIFEKEKKYLLIRFADNGIGLKKGENKKIFKIFYQRRHHESIPLGGSGIGLYLVHQIAQLHHGKIDVVSAGENKGAVFTLRLPYTSGDNLK